MPRFKDLSLIAGLQAVKATDATVLQDCTFVAFTGSIHPQVIGTASSAR
jgi:hypothetical protein